MFIGFYLDVNASEGSLEPFCHWFADVFYNYKWEAEVNVLFLLCYLQ